MRDLEGILIPRLSPGAAKKSLLPLFWLIPIGVVFSSDSLISRPSDPVSFLVSMGEVVNVKNFGAKGDGLQDDTAAIQAAVDRAFALKGGQVFLPPGIYLVTSVSLGEGITIKGSNAIIKRPDHLTDRVGRDKAKWIRTFTTEKRPYCGTEDSRPLVIEGLIFDGSSYTQGAYRSYELEQAALLFLTANVECPGRLRVIVRDCTFRNGVGDGIHVHTNTYAEVTGCSSENVFRGGVVLTGGNSVLKVKRFVGTGDVDAKGIDVEVDSPGYRGTYRTEVALEDVQLKNGGLDIQVKEGSVVAATGVVAGPSVNIYAEDSFLSFTNCSFWTSPGDAIIFPHSVTFKCCAFTASSKGSPKNGVVRHAAPFVVWNLAGKSKNSQSLTFDNCRFDCEPQINGPPQKCFGILTGWDDIMLGNVLILKDGLITQRTDVGIGTQFRGGNWRIKGTIVESSLPISWTGYPETGGKACMNIIVEEMKVHSKKYMHITGYPDPVCNSLTHVGVEIQQEANYISSTYGLEGNEYRGNRVIIGIQPPKPSTHGLPGDLYRVLEPPTEWVCTKPGYFHEGKGKDVPSAWRRIRGSSSD